MEIKEINSKEVWENFMAQAKPATFLQSWNWGEFNAQTDHKIWRLGAYKNDKLIAVAMILKVIARRGSFLFCPYGPIVIPATEPESSKLWIPAFAGMTEYLKPIAKAEKCVFMRFSPLVSPFPKGSTPEAGGILNPPSPSDHPPLIKEEVFTDLGYREAPTHMMHPELTWVLDIRPTEEQLLAQMRKTTRYSIKKAEKDGVTVTTSNNPMDLPKFLALYDQTVKRQEFKPFSRKYFEKEMEIFSKENQALLFFAEYQGETVGAAFIIFYGGYAFYHHAATTRKFSKLTDAQLLQWNVIKEAKRRGLSFYNFWGVSPETAVKHPWHGFSVFKRGFGGFETSYVHAKDLVLSPRYLLTYLIEKARKIKRRL